jgi:hypothetical protein
MIDKTVVDDDDDDDDDDLHTTNSTHFIQNYCMHIDL